MKFALVTADKANSVTIRFKGDRDDSIGFMSWLGIWNGIHYSYESIRNDFSMLFECDCVMFSGCPSYMKDIVTIATSLKKKVVTMFLPEGDICLYDQLGINSFNSVTYEAMRAVDVMAIMEEDKIPYYSLLTNSLVKFIHVPIDDKMSKGDFFVKPQDKEDYFLVYGDNNPNCPVTVFSIVSKLGNPVVTIAVPLEKIQSIRETFGITIKFALKKLGQYPFLEALGRSKVHIYPTRWIGSAREQVACAIVGTPCIGSDRSHTQRRLFPKLSCDIYDVGRMMELTKRLYENADFYNGIVDYAWSQLPFYNMENTKQRFMDAYEEARKRW